jgi:hypothetical protein
MKKPREDVAPSRGFYSQLPYGVGAAAPISVNVLLSQMGNGVIPAALTIIGMASLARNPQVAAIESMNSRSVNGILTIPHVMSSQTNILNER